MALDIHSWIVTRRIVMYNGPLPGMISKTFAVVDSPYRKYDMTVVIAESVTVTDRR